MNPLKKYIGRPQGPDSLRSWFVATFASLYMFFGWCAFSSTPVLYVALMKTNPELMRELASWPFTIMSCCSFAGSESCLPTVFAFFFVSRSQNKILLKQRLTSGFFQL